VRTVTAGNVTMQQWGPGEWTTLEFTSPRSEPRPLPVGNHTMTAELRIDVVLEQRYGVTSVDCASWTRTETLVRSLTVTRSVPIEAVDSENLTVDVHVYDRPGEDVVAVSWDGQQGLAAGAAGWETVEVQVGEKTMSVTAPWRFFSVSRNTHVEERSDGATSETAASHSIDGEYPALLRYRMSPATVEMVADKTADRHVWWEPTDVVANGSIAATPLPATIVAPANHERSPLYDRYAGVLKSTDVRTGESVSATTGDVWGDTVATNLTVTRYERPVLAVLAVEESRAARILFQTSDGAPIGGRQIYLEGADVPVVTTDELGSATVLLASPILRAHFRGDDWREAHETYYLPARSIGVWNAAPVVGAIEVMDYLTDAISMVVLFAEWVVLGVFAVIWRRYMRQRPR
jgi:hypothetical protein